MGNFGKFWDKSIVFTRVLRVGFGTYRLVRLLMECSCMAPLIPVVMVLRGLGSHPLFCMILIKGKKKKNFHARR